MKHLLSVHPHVIFFFFRLTYASNAALKSGNDGHHGRDSYGLTVVKGGALDGTPQLKIVGLVWSVSEYCPLIHTK